MANQNKEYLITSHPAKALIVFAVPMIIGNLFQQFYSMVDSIVVGRFVGEGALAAIGASTAFTNIFIWAAQGGSIGASVLTGRYFGAGDHRSMKESAYTTLTSFLALGILFAFVGLLIGRPVMTAMKTPADVMGDAMIYLNIYFLGLPFLFMYNALSSIFNALGRSGIPLYLLIFSSLFNVVLDILLVTRLHMGVDGVAWATLIAQGISAIISFILFMREMQSYSALKLSDQGRLPDADHPGDCRLLNASGKRVKCFYKDKLIAQTRIALPSVLQQSTVSIGMMLVQSVVNSFGAQSLAGFSAAMKIENIVVVPMAAIGNALSSFTAQNLGAGKEDRVERGYRIGGYGLTAIFAAVILVILQLFNRQLAELFLGSDGSAAACAAATGYMRFVGCFYYLIGIKMAADGVLRGAGDMKMFTIANLANLTLRVIVARTMAPAYGISWVWYAVPLGWLINYLIAYLEYRTGRWRTL
ncbi:MAG: MATE family efflux transporter [Eubacterium sp.]|nr:MATE family efflux transporter [Eubacterium sp.]